MPDPSIPPRARAALLVPLLSLSGVAWLALSGAAGAQEEAELPEVRRVYEAQDDANEAAGRVLGTLEGYGRESRAPLTSVQARRRALARINGVRPPRSRREAMDPDQAKRELLAFREALIGRLRELDPKRYPEPRYRVPKRERLRLAVYRMSDLVSSPPDHVAPTVGLAIGSGIAYDMGGEEIAQPILDPLVVIELIEEELRSIGALATEQASIEFTSGRLVVRHTSAGHAKVREVLARLRSIREGQLFVELRFYKLPREVFAAVAQRATGLSDADEELLAKAVASKQATLLSTHQVMAADGQRVVVRQGGSRAIVADVEVNQTGVVPVINPVVQNVNEGLVLELRGLADRAQQVVHLDMSLTRAKLSKEREVRKISGIEIELPELALTRTAASLIVPLGRGAFLAGSLAGGSDEDAVVVYTRVRLTQGRK